MLWFLKWMCLGIGACLAVTALLIFVAGLATKAGAHEQAVRAATMGEQDRSLNYREPHTVIQTLTIEEYSNDFTAAKGAYRCEQINLVLYAKIELIAERIAAKPHLGYVWIDALNAIHSSWCTE